MDIETTLNERMAEAWKQFGEDMREASQNILKEREEARKNVDPNDIIKPLDFVKTPAGNIAIVSEVRIDSSGRQNVSITFIGKRLPDTHCKNAWWEYPVDGLVIIDNLPRVLASQMMHPFGDGGDMVDKYFGTKRF